MDNFKKLVLALGILGTSSTALWADEWVTLLEVPDYDWYAGCFGTACGNLMGYWDRHGLPDFYTGPTAGGVAPLLDLGYVGIRSMWASQAGFDGRPSNLPGHIDDYSVGYESTSTDPYITAGRQEHAPDCIGDFIGLSQKKWTNMNNECDGNIDAFCFNYWDTNGNRRSNFVPVDAAGLPVRDLQSGLREWTKYRGYDADVFSQLTDFNPTKPLTNGFTFADLKAEIAAGYPVLLFLQDFYQMYRPISGMAKANPLIHGMLAFGYVDDPASGLKWVFYRTSWHSGDGWYSPWNSGVWQAGMPLRGVICYHPKPKVRSVTRGDGNITLAWDGPSSQLYDHNFGITNAVHSYQVERSLTLSSPSWEPVGQVTNDRTVTIPDCCGDTVFLRVRLLQPGDNR